MATHEEIVTHARYLRDRYPRHSMNEIIKMLHKDFSHALVQWFSDYLWLRYGQRSKSYEEKYGYRLERFVGEKAIEEYHDCNDQEKVNESAGDMESVAEQPRENQNCDDDV